ncbi:MAG TPA: porin family protein [Bacteroidales bacterium]|nr:porin family protein [Bacteroidales bacterium]
MYKLFAGIVLIMLSFGVTAQSFSGGIIAGFNASQVDGDSYAGYNKFGFTVGAFTARKLSESFSGEMQIRYVQKGASKKVNENDLSKYTSKLNYIELPLLLRYHQNEKLSWHAGPAFGYLFKYSVEDENGPLTSDAISFRDLELSATAGVQYKLIKNLDISMSFSYSLVSISDHPNDPIHFRQPGLYNNVVTILLAYSL